MFQTIVASLVSTISLFSVYRIFSDYSIYIFSIEYNVLFYYGFLYILSALELGNWTRQW